MTSATSSTAYCHPLKAPARRVSLWLAVAVAAFVTILIGLPDGVAAPLQAVLAWSVVAAVAVLAVMAIAKGLDRLLDCENR